jgi:hypothetical protein
VTPTGDGFFFWFSHFRLSQVTCGAAIFLFVAAYCETLNLMPKVTVGLVVLTEVIF